MSQQDFDLIYRQCFPKVLRYFRMKGFSEFEAYDLTQDTFLRVFKGWDSYQDRISALGWVLTVAESIWKNKIRAIKTHKRDGQIVNLEDRVEPPSKEQSPESQTSEKENIRLLSQAMSQLPQAMRITFYYRTQKELKYKEIARLMGVSIDTVKKQLHEAKKKLREILGPALTLRDEDDSSQSEEG